jgi:uncharacterized protein
MAELFGGHYLTMVFCIVIELKHFPAKLKTWSTKCFGMMAWCACLKSALWELQEIGNLKVDESFAGRHHKVVWTLLGARAGDNAQVQSLASRLDADVQHKQIVFNALHALPNAVLGSSLYSIDAEKSGIVAPWPDMVIGVGKRTASVARHIQKMTQGRVRNIHLGRPRAALHEFDLIITTPQYGLPKAPNVIEMPLPFVTARHLSTEERDQWAAEWQELERPWTIAALGGPKFPLQLGAAELEQFGARLNRQLAKTGGSVILMSSPRSHPQALELVATRLEGPAWYDVGRKKGNPYLAALSLGDRFAVTGDSVSMIGEMLETHRPVGVLRLPVSHFRMKWRGDGVMTDALARLGLVQPPRDVDGLVGNLMKAGHIHPLGDVSADHNPLIRNDDVVVARVRALLG